MTMARFEVTIENKIPAHVGPEGLYWVESINERIVSVQVDDDPSESQRFRAGAEALMEVKLAFCTYLKGVESRILCIDEIKPAI